MKNRSIHALALLAAIAFTALTASTTYAEGAPTVLGSAAGIGPSNGEIDGEGRDIVLSTAYCIRPSAPQAAGKRRDLVLSTGTVNPLPRPRSRAEPLQNPST